MKFKRFVINLDRRPDRLAEFFERYGDAGDVTRFSAVDGIKKFEGGNFNEVEGIVYAGLSLGGFLNRPGVFGCWMSHLTLWDELIFSDCDAFVIFEDDAFLVDDFQNKLNLILSNVNQDLDIIYIGGRFSREFTPNDMTRNWFMVNNFFYGYGRSNAFIRTTHGYVITRAGASKLMDLIMSFSGKKKLPAVDDWLSFLRNDGLINSVDFFPHICYSPINYKSDIQLIKGRRKT